MCRRPSPSASPGKVPRRRARRVEVPNEDPLAVARGLCADVDRGRGLADTALLRAVARDRPARRLPALPDQGADPLRPHRRCVELGKRASPNSARATSVPRARCSTSPAHGEERVGWRAPSRWNLPPVSLHERLGLHGAVLVLAQVVLQVLECGDEGLQLGRREQRSVALEEVAQDLGLLAQVVQILGGRRRVDRAAVAAASAGSTFADPLAGDRLDRLAGVGSSSAPGGSAAQRLPGAQRGAGSACRAGRARSFARSRSRRRASSARSGSSSAARSSPTCAASSGHSSSCTSRSRTGPVSACAHFSSSRSVRAGLRVVDVLELAQHGARAADRDAQVVQELRVEVVERAREVGLRDLAQPAEHERRRGVGARPARAARRSSFVGDARPAARRPPAPPRRRAAASAGSSPSSSRSTRERALVGAVVAEHGPHRQPRRQRRRACRPPRSASGARSPGARPSCGRRRRTASDCTPEAHADRRQQRALLEHGRQALAHGALRQLRDQEALRARHARRGAPARRPRAARAPRRGRPAARPASRPRAAARRSCPAASGRSSAGAPRRAPGARGAGRSPPPDPATRAGSGRRDPGPRRVVFHAMSEAARRRDRAQVPAGPPAGRGCPAGEPFEQGYLALAPDGTEVRIRRRAGRSTLTVKSGPAHVRVEEALDIDDRRFEALWALTEGRRIAKTRHLVPLGGGLTAEVDVYAEALDGPADRRDRVPLRRGERGLRAARLARPRGHGRRALRQPVARPRGAPPSRGGGVACRPRLPTAERN